MTTDYLNLPVNNCFDAMMARSYSPHQANGYEILDLSCFYFILSIKALSIYSIKFSALSHAPSFLFHIALGNATGANLFLSKEFWNHWPYFGAHVSLNFELISHFGTFWLKKPISDLNSSSFASSAQPFSKGWIFDSYKRILDCPIGFDSSKKATPVGISNSKINRSHYISSSSLKTKAKAAKS